MRLAGNAYNLQEFAGAFGDLGTLIPFVVGYITVNHMDPAGILVGFGIFKLWAGFYFKTPVPIQPMKAIGTAAITQGGAITHGAIFASGLFTGVVWGFMGLSGAVSWIEKITRRPVVQGIVLGLGLGFVVEGIKMTQGDPSPERQQGQHRREARVREQHEGHGARDSGEEEVAVRHLHALHDEPQAQAEDDALHDWPAGDLLDPAHRAREPHEHPDHASEEARREDRAGRDSPALRYGGRTNGLHGLDRDGGLEIEACPELEDPESDEDARGVHVVDRDVADHEGDQRAKVAESARELLQIIPISGSRPCL